MGACFGKRYTLLERKKPSTFCEQKKRKQKITLPTTTRIQTWCEEKNCPTATAVFSPSMENVNLVTSNMGCVIRHLELRVCQMLFAICADVLESENNFRFIFLFLLFYWSLAFGSSISLVCPSIDSNCDFCFSTIHVQCVSNHHGRCDARWPSRRRYCIE